MKIYHGTSTKNLTSILRDGIKPRAYSGQSSVWPDSGSYPEQVYLTTAFPFLFALPAAGMYQTLLVFEVESDALDPEKFYPDEHVFGDVFDPNWQESLEHMGVCAYRGIIPPSALTRYVCLNSMLRDELAAFLGSAFPLTVQQYMNFGRLHRDMVAWVFGDVEQLPPSDQYLREFVLGLTRFCEEETGYRDGITVVDVQRSQKESSVDYTQQ